MKTLAVLLVALISPFALAHGHGQPTAGHHLIFAGGALHAHISWVQGPALSPNESILRVQWMDSATHTPIEPGGSFAIEPFMPAHGHGTAPVPAPAAVLDQKGDILLGAYNVNGIYFTMGGAWEIRLHRQAPDGTIETQSFTEEIQGGHGHH
ncbi:MAG: hypothetical protein AB7F86_20090 [Bdellovibrionales bacterium]